VPLPLLSPLVSSSPPQRRVVAEWRLPRPCLLLLRCHHQHRHHRAVNALPAGVLPPMRTGCHYAANLAAAALLPCCRRHRRHCRFITIATLSPLPRYHSCPAAALPTTAALLLPPLSRFHCRCRTTGTIAALPLPLPCCCGLSRCVATTTTAAALTPSPPPCFRLCCRCAATNLPLPPLSLRIRSAVGGEGAHLHEGARHRRRTECHTPQWFC
jgi:hypothetical protein